MEVVKSGIAPWLINNLTQFSDYYLVLHSNKILAHLSTASDRQVNRVLIEANILQAYADLLSMCCEKNLSSDELDKSNEEVEEVKFYEVAEKVCFALSNVITDFPIEVLQSQAFMFIMNLTGPILPTDDSDMPEQQITALPYRMVQVYFCIGNMITTCNYH